MRRLLVGLLALGLLASVASAQPYYVRGDFNGWGPTDEMVDDGDGSYSLSIDMSAQPLGETFQFKCATEDWSVNGPPNNAQLRYVDGDITFHFFPNIADDGWMPPTAWSPHRVGWDPTTGFEIMGTFNEWAAPLPMTDEGGGLFALEMAVTAGTHEFKFRAPDDWGINIGSTFEYNGPNASVDFAADGMYRFELDVPNGRWHVVPEPTALLGLVLLTLLRRR